jgi:hypothetical protein
MSVILPDSERKEESKRGNVMAPFAVFGIMLGCAIILIRVLPLFGNLQATTKTEILSICVILSAIGGLVTSLVSLRSWVKGSWGDRLVYFLIPGVFVVLAVCYGASVWQ